MKKALYCGLLLLGFAEAASGQKEQSAFTKMKRFLALRLRILVQGLSGCFCGGR